MRLVIFFFITVSLALLSTAAVALASPPVFVKCRGGTPFPAQPSNNTFFPYVRPPLAQRKFSSPAVEQTIAWVRNNLADAALAELYTNTFPNALDTTFFADSFFPPAGKNLTFVITGDIHAMWLRDSTNQVLPYMSLVAIDPKLSAAVVSLIERQLFYVLHDPYANAFNPTSNASSDGPHQGDSRTPPMTPLVYEGKFEVDSLAAVLKLLVSFCDAHNKNKGGGVCLTWIAPNFSGGAPFLHMALSRIIAALTDMQSAEESVYKFERHHPDRDVYPNSKFARCGLVRSAFRPSDDETKYSGLIPSNLMLAVELRKLSAACGTNDALWLSIAATAKKLRSDILSGVERYAAASPSGNMCYEVDGFGNCNEMDDANIPSLLSLPYLGVGEGEIAGFARVYTATRAAVLNSATNPYFYAGPTAAGEGSPHTPKSFVWPLALSTQLVTALMMKNASSVPDMEILGLLFSLKRSAAGSGVMHESFDVFAPRNCTRNWFAWANSFFGYAINTLIRLRPDLSLKPNHAPVPNWFPNP